MNKNSIIEFIELGIASHSGRLSLCAADARKCLESGDLKGVMDARIEGEGHKAVIDELNVLLDFIEVGGGND